MTNKKPRLHIPNEERWRLDRLSNERLAQKYLVPLADIKLIANGARVHSVGSKVYQDIQEDIRYRDKLRNRLQKPL